jgi:hypothetical protein
LICRLAWDDDQSGDNRYDQVAGKIFRKRERKRERERERDTWKV